MFNKDITHPKMRRKIKNPRVVLLDCPLEYKKGESSTNVEITKESDWELMLKQEEEEVSNCSDRGTQSGWMNSDESSGCERTRF